MDNLFANMTEIVWNTNATKDEEVGLYSYKSFGQKYVRQHDTIFQCAKTEDFKFFKLWKPNKEQQIYNRMARFNIYPCIPNPKNLKTMSFM